MTMTDEQLKILKHALGLDQPEKIKNGVTWRDYYCTTAGDPVLEDLVAQGYMSRGRVINSGRDQYYHASEKAMDLLEIEEIRR